MVAMQASQRVFPWSTRGIVRELLRSDRSPSRKSVCSSTRPGGGKAEFVHFSGIRPLFFTSGLGNGQYRTCSPAVTLGRHALLAAVLLTAASCGQSSDSGPTTATSGTGVGGKGGNERLGQLWSGGSGGVGGSPAGGVAGEIKAGGDQGSGGNPTRRGRGGRELWQ